MVRRGGVRNSPAAVDALVTANLPLVGYHVSELLGRVPAYVSRDDLASAGSLALVLAAQAYDADTGVPFVPMGTDKYYRPASVPAGSARRRTS